MVETEIENAQVEGQFYCCGKLTTYSETELWCLLVMLQLILAHDDGRRHLELLLPPGRATLLGPLMSPPDVCNFEPH